MKTDGLMTCHIFEVGAFFLATLFNVMRVSGTMRKIMLELTKEGI